MNYRNFGFNENIGDSTTRYYGDYPRIIHNIPHQYLINHGQFKIGYVVHSFGQHYTCLVTYENGTREAIWLTPLLGGFEQSALITVPSENTQVLLYEPLSGPLLILGVIPTPTDGYGINFEVEPFSFSYSKLLLYNETDIKPSGYSNYNSGRPLDIFPGEFSVISDYGNLVAVLKGLSILKGSDLSQIQCSLLDNLLRIISYTYEHFTSFKEEFNYVDDIHNIYEKYCYFTLEEYFKDYEVKEGDRIIELANKPIRLPSLVYIKGNLIEGEAKYYKDKSYCIFNEGLKHYHSKEIEFILGDNYKGTPIRSKEYYKENIIEISTLKPFKYNEEHLGEQQDIAKIKYDCEQYNYKNYKNDAWEFQNKNNETIPKSWIKLREDGSIILRGKEGNFIELSNDGKIIISAPNDIEIRTGGRTLILSKETFTIRSKQDIEAVTSEGDITVLSNGKFNVHSKAETLMETEGHYKVNSDKTISFFSEDNINVFSQRNIIEHALSEHRTEATKITEASAIKGTMGIISDGIDITASPNAPMQDYEINATNINIMGVYSKERIEEEKQIGAKKIKIEGQENTTIYGGGPLGTNVNHTHIASEMIYVPDSAGGEKVATIQKQGAHEEVTITPLVHLLTSLLMSPYFKDFLQSLLAQFNVPASKQLDEHYWQKHRETVWNLLQDVLNNSTPQPNNDKYYKYQDRNFIEDNLGDFKC